MNGTAATVHTCSIENCSAQYTSIMRQLKDYLKEDSAQMCDEKKNALLDVSLGWSAALLKLDGACDDMLKITSYKN